MELKQKRRVFCCGSAFESFVFASAADDCWCENRLKQKFQEDPKMLAVTASTGIAAVCVFVFE